MVNPYASEDFNRVKVRQSTQDLEDRKKVDHPLVEGKKMDMSHKELSGFTKAMGEPEFQDLMSEYVDEISNPKFRDEQDRYLLEMKEKNEMPGGADLIQPEAGFCMKTMAKRMVSDIKKSFFEQKVFINVCWHESVDKPKQVPATQANGEKGMSW
jgi:dynein assembly factor 2